jgi:hypothetical protein
VFDCSEALGYWGKGLGNMRNDCSIAEQLRTQLTFTGTFNESIAFSLSSLVLSTIAVEMQKSKK